MQIAINAYASSNPHLLHISSSDAGQCMSLTSVRLYMKDKDASVDIYTQTCTDILACAHGVIVLIKGL